MLVQIVTVKRSQIIHMFCPDGGHLVLLIKKKKTEVAFAFTGTKNYKAESTVTKHEKNKII